MSEPTLQRTMIIVKTCFINRHATSLKKSYKTYEEKYAQFPRRPLALVKNIYNSSKCGVSGGDGAEKGHYSIEKLCLMPMVFIALGAILL